MFNETFFPRFTDTDALGHINNTLVPVWFEGARDPIFKIFMPELDITNWQLILAKIDVTFHEQMHYGAEMEVRTYISRIGNSSFDVYQELWQHNKKCASGKAVMVHFCFDQQKSKVISTELIIKMEAHMLIENNN
jgi:acyl-CoA thioester hydrolase